MSECYQPVWTWDGRAAILNTQARQMLESPDAIAKELNRLSMKPRVYIVFHKAGGFDYSGPAFVGVFFSRESAETWIKGRQYPRVYFIETYEQPKDGMAEEVFY